MGLKVREHNAGENENLISSEAKFHVLKLLLTAILLTQSHWLFANFKSSGVGYLFKEQVKL